MIDCTLVTCKIVPALDPDDRILVHELRRRSLTVSVEVWNDPHVDWAASRLCLIRSTWDYHSRYCAFIAWIERVAAVTTIRNDRLLLCWNAHKSYLRELERLGVPVVPTEWVSKGSRRDIGELCATRGWRDVVIKPAQGAAAHKVVLVRHDERSLAAGQGHLDRLAGSQDVLIQPYLPAVATYGERALIFFEDRYSHAVVKKPFDTVLAVNNTISTRVEATPEEISVASRAAEALPGDPLYARVDLLRDAEGNPRVSEVELIEPALYLAVHEPAPARFADAIEREIDSLRDRL